MNGSGGLSVRRLVFLMLRLIGLPFLLRELIQRRRVSILCYHDPRPEDFARHLRILTRLYNVISLRRYLEWRRDPAQTLPPKSLVFTFDDGHCGNYQLRDLLARCQIPATIFLCSSIVGTRRHFWWKEAHDLDRELLKSASDGERIRALEDSGFTELREYSERQALSAQEIEELKALVDFQSHTRFHPILSHCSDERAAEEIRDSKIELEQRFGVPVYAIAYPNGDHTARDVGLARGAGYECALTIDGGYNNRNTDAFRLRRLRIADAAGEHELIVKASGLWAIWERVAVRRAGDRSSATGNEAKEVARNVLIG